MHKISFASRWLGCMGWLIAASACAGTTADRATTRDADPGALDILVVAPHPDDETLNCAGVIQQALVLGRRVGVAILTNGDGYDEAAAALVKKPTEELTAEDFLELARVRQQMSIDSMEVLGGARTDLHFLGYPDGGLAKIYRLEGDAPFTSPVNGRSQTYGPVMPDHHTTIHGTPAPYLPSAVKDDIVSIIRQLRPREIYVTHDADSHDDHKAAFWLVRDAAIAAGFKGPLFTYVGHGDAVPQLPVRHVKLTPVERERKQRAIKVHALPVVHDTLGDEVSDNETFWIYELK